MIRLKIIQKLVNDLSIATKFFIAFGALLGLLLVSALTGFIALNAVEKRADEAINVSNEIQRVVLEMDAGLKNARRFEWEFFVRYPVVGFEPARDDYANANYAQIDKVIALSETLKSLIVRSNVSAALQDRNVDLNFFLSAAARYKESFNGAVGLAEQLAGKDTGAEARLERQSETLLNSLEATGEPELTLLFREMQSYTKDYLLTRQRPNMQLAFNTSDDLRDAIQNHSGLTAAKKDQAISELDSYLGIAKEILALDVEIRSHFTELDVQTAAIDPIAKELVILADEQVKMAQDQIAQTSRSATILLLISLILSVILSTSVGYLFHNDITANVLKLTVAATSVEENKFEPDSLDGLAVRNDDLGRLARVFQKMAREVRLREEKLKQQVTELKIALDETRQKKKVAEITDSQYFKDLQSEADALRNIISGTSDKQE
jgi:hypothetical protein